MEFSGTTEDYLDFVDKLDRFRRRYGEQDMLPFDYEPGKDDGKSV